jgi:hypothetical protein
MEILNEERIRSGTRRLLTAPHDLQICGAAAWPHRSPQDCTPAHRESFAAYEQQILMVADAALDWWNQTVEARKRSADDPRRAVREAWLNRPAGPASFPGVVSLVRDYWLMCEAINQKSEEPRRVAPEAFLLLWLMDGKHQAEVKVLSCMPYWPIGLDAEGHWV